MRLYLQVAALVACGIGMATSGLWSTVILWRMVDDVNVSLPEAERFSPYGWYALKYARLLREYRRLYPTGKGIEHLRLLWLVAVLSAGCGVLLLGFGLGAAGVVTAGGCVVGWLWYRK